MQESVSPARVALKWGVIMGVAYMIYSTILYLTGQFANAALGWLSFLISIVFLYLAMRDFREQNSGFMSYGEGVSVGTLTSVVAGLISATYGLVYTSFIDPTIPEQMAEKMQEQYEAQGLSDEQIEQTMEMMSWVQSPGMTFLFGVLGAAFGGLIISLIIAAFMRRNKPVFD